MSQPVLIEACVESTEGALAAARGGAQRVELCAALIEGGLTPSFGEAALCRERLRIALHVMVRPRGGDFLYSEAEHDVMLRDIDTLKAIGVDGVVFGALDPEGRVDEARMRELVGRARPLAITFHRAFDACADPHAALDTLARLGVDRVLTSGQEATALEGLELLVELVARAAGRLGVMPACGDLLPRHVRHVVDTSRAPECHVTGFAGRESGMRFRRARLYMGGALRPPEYHRSVTTADEIRSVVDALHVP